MDAIKQLETLNMLLSMCTESCNPDQFEQVEAIVEYLKKTRGSMKHEFKATGDQCQRYCRHCGEKESHDMHI